MESKFVQQEKDILAFWQEHKIFEKSLEQTKNGAVFSFYDGPPFATGLPHYGHLVAGLMKDVIPRYQTMRGRYVTRRWGWDCHGLPVENLIEQELGLKEKKDIQNFGVAKFNDACRHSVLRYASEWRKTVQRVGRWIDMDDDYKTMEAGYMESIWWVLKTLWDKDLIYQGYKSMHICPRCDTTLSNFEVTQNYQEVKDLSVIAKFELLDQPGTFILAWTTTPWTLPGNVALAMNQEVDYIKIKLADCHYILARANLENIFAGQPYEIVGSVKAKDLEAKKYQPLFDYFAAADLENKKNLYTIQLASFVTTDDGTGVVHIAPGFGEDDMSLGQKNHLPTILHVDNLGHFTAEVKDFAGLAVKPKADPQSTDRQVVDYLRRQGLVLKADEYIHSYPFCWRCDTPLLNYATTSWFVKVTEIRKQLLKNNHQINWVPSHVKAGRFGRWLADAKDWAISRNRFWGTPLPIWQSLDGKKLELIGSLADLYGKAVKKNTFYLARHGQSLKNQTKIENNQLETSDRYPLTEQGKKEAADLAVQAKKLGITKIISSPYARVKQTAEIVGQHLNLPVVLDQRLGEVWSPAIDGMASEEYHKLYLTPFDHYQTPDKIETPDKVASRMLLAIKELNEKYSNEKILVVSHGDPIWYTQLVAFGYNLNSHQPLLRGQIQPYPEVGELINPPLLTELITPEGEYSLHRPYLDQVVLANGAKRIPEVLDCWFESGSMPYAQSHYPFAQEAEFKTTFPAEFIAEGIDQTRGWFYTLLVLSTALFNQPAYKNVIANGIVLAQDGAKMSKRLKNYPEPVVVMDQYGADALRYYLLSSPVMEGENLNFSEAGVKEALQKVVMLLDNVLSFYKLYNQSDANLRMTSESTNVKNVLDRWILAKFNLLIQQVTESLDSYYLIKAIRPLQDFINDLSTWYVRRSRDRFKAGDQGAVVTLGQVLLGLAQVMAPFTPFIAEYVYQELKKDNAELTAESVHLQTWPKVEKKLIDEELLKQMSSVRQLVEQGLSARAAAGIKVRQPLAELKVKNAELRIDDQALLALVKDELNVKAVSFNAKIENENELDINITEELKAEGQAREIIRQINQLRKDQGLTIQDKVVIYQTGLDGIFGQFDSIIKKSTLAVDIQAGTIDLMQEIEGGRVGIKKINK